METVIITPRLLPGVRVGGAFVSIDPTGARDRRGAPEWRWYVDLPDGGEHTGAELCGWGDARAMLETLLGFLAACGESVNYQRRTGRDGECAELFPPAVAEWAAANADDISVVGFDLEEAAAR